MNPKITEEKDYLEGIIVLPTGQILSNRFKKDGVKYEIFRTISKGYNIFDCEVELRKVDTGEVGIVSWKDLHKYNTYTKSTATPVILCDTREKTKAAKELAFRLQGYQMEEVSMTSGDYSYTLDGESNEYRFIIERKSGVAATGGGWSELVSNWAEKGYGARIKKEFKRLEDVRNVFLIVENATSTSWKDVKRQSYKQLADFRTNFKESFDMFLAVTNNRRALKGHNPIVVICLDAADFEKKIIELVEQDIIDKVTSQN
jgi:hypothetical protein